MTGRLSIIGTGPGNPDQMTLEAANAIADARHFFGYKPYIDRLALKGDQIVHPSDNREELGRAAAALDLAAAGESVAVVSGGDPGVFAMAAAVCEAVDTGPDAWRRLDITVVPGVSAMFAVAARVGAPLGHDFCAISLSDNLKPWEVIEARLVAAAGAGFVIALYNPASKARPHQLDTALGALRAVLPAETLIIFGRAAGRADEKIVSTILQEARGDMADMATCVIIGSAETRLIGRSDRTPLIYTPRHYGRLSQ